MNVDASTKIQGCLTKYVYWVYATKQQRISLSMDQILLSIIIYSASMKSYRYFEKYIIQLFGYCYVHVSGQQQAGLER